MEVTAEQTASGRRYVGTIEESSGISLSFSGSGTVEQALVGEGQKVAKGQLLATLNDATAHNAHEVAQAKLVQAQDAYDRLAKVHAGGSLPDIKFAEVEAGLQQAKSMAAISKKSLDDCRLYAPQSGVIATRNIEAGANVMPGVPVFKLVLIDKVSAKIFVPENEINSTHTGQNAVIIVAALNNAEFTGKIEAKGIVADRISHAYEVKIGVNNPQSELMPGMVCKVFLAGEEGTSEIVVPNRTIQISTDDRRYVWLAEGDVARRRFVKTGNLTDNGIIVTEGLSTGDKLIIEGFQKVSDGMKINYELR
jgi:RND family efflux transporter MFP subunit